VWRWRVLGDEAHQSELFGPVGGTSTEHFDRAIGRREEANGKVEERRLSRTVGADEADNLSFGDG
jgi:hypothetical protein